MEGFIGDATRGTPYDCKPSKTQNKTPLYNKQLNQNNYYTFKIFNSKCRPQKRNMDISIKLNFKTKLSLDLDNCSYK